MIKPKKMGKGLLAFGLSVLMLGTNVANAESYKLEKPINVYSTAYDAKMKKNPVTTYRPGTYNIFRKFDGQINISKTSNPGGWINPSDVKGSTSGQSSGASQNTGSANQNQKPTQNKKEIRKTYKSTAVVNVRTGAGTSYSVLGTVPYGSEISGVKVGNWIRITYNGQTAYTIADYYKEVTSNQTSNNQTYKNYYATSDVYVRSGKGSNYAKVGINYLGSKIYGVIEGPWLKFTYNGKTAYTAAAYYTEKSPLNNKPSQDQNPTIANAKEFVSTTAVYFRSGKGSSYAKLGINYKGDVIKGIVEGPWIKFIYNNKYAYTAAAYYTQKGVSKPKPIEKDPFENVKLTKFKAESSVYVRSSKSSGNKTKVGIVSKGDIIDGVIDGAWIKFKFNGTVAYTAKAYYTAKNSNKAPGNDKSPITPSTSDKMVIVIDPGHGPGIANNRGGLLFNEGDQNFKFSQYFLAEARKYKNLIVRTTRPSNDLNPSLEERGKAGAGADLYLSFHTNAMPITRFNRNSNVRGVEIYSSNYSKNNKMAYEITNMVSTTLGTPNRGVKFAQYSGAVYNNPVPGGTDYYAVFRNGNTASTRYLIEFVFHTNLADSQAYLNNQTKLAKNLMDIIAKNYDLH